MIRIQSRGEEIANSVIHGVGAVLSIAALVILIVFASWSSDAWRITGLSIFGASLLFMYLNSTLYHSLKSYRAKRVFKVLDHCSIYLVIAGSYTPVLLGPLRGTFGWVLFGVIWAAAVAGVVYKSLVFRRFKIISILSYLCMGWVALLMLKPLWTAASPHLIIWLLIGGLCYSLGTVFYGWRRLNYHHAIWHVFVLAGSLAHIFGFLFFVASA